MKKLLCILLLCCSILPLISCGTETMSVTPSGKLPEVVVTGEPSESEAEGEKDIPVLPYGNLEIAVGESHSLDLPKGEWAVSNPDVAAMDR
ncbi:MAG: hypothetical protein IKZ21_01425, partial [Clostridia bacterium]|nr:hypothetical protein [Clostridia bacterium]